MLAALLGVGFAGLCATALRTGRQATVLAAETNRRSEGAELFASTGCSHCHGADRAGTEKGPSLRDVRRKLTVAQMRRQIENGGQSMPPFADQLNSHQVEALIVFLRSRAPAPKVATRAASSP